MEMVPVYWYRGPLLPDFSVVQLARYSLVLSLKTPRDVQAFLFTP